MCCPFAVPALRERRSDMAALVEVLCDDIAQRDGLPHLDFTPEALALLAGQHWRGNIRELRNVLEQAAMSSDSLHIDTEELAHILRESGLEQIAPAIAPAAAATEAGSNLLRPLAVQVAELEQQALHAALQATQGNKQAAARLLGISRAKLYERLENPGS